LAKLIGWNIILRYIMGNLDIPTLEAKSSKILGGKTQAVLMEYPEIGFDVDNQTQLNFVEERLDK
ncbi:MAG TPA: molybdopterin-guanine dinucleotide biosynthesis protein A, partial [bacterium]|nr:molybdopterin-guanine dinucleotide biosynthesis protein A [bacterium]